MSHRRESRRRFRLPRSLRDLVGRELDEEVSLHLELRARELEARGLSPEEARREAQRRFGSVEALRREARKRERTIHVRDRLGDLVRDLRFALRGLRRNPTFAAAAILTLALGIGATTAIYSVVHPVLFEPLPYPQPDRIVTVWERDGNGDRMNVGFTTYLDVAERVRSLESAAALRPWQPILTGDGSAERLDGQRVSWTFFRTLGVAPALGRDFQAEEDAPQTERVAILSHSLWRTRFGGDPEVVGRAILLDGNPTTVIGVLPADFESLLRPEARIWAPLRYDVSQSWACRSCRHIRAVARTAPGVTVDAVNREVEALAATLRQEHPTEYPQEGEAGMEVVPLQTELTREVRPALLAVLGAVALVLLVACANVSHLLLARAAQRHGNLAIRAALGESRARVVRSLLVESLVIALFGGLLGLAIAVAGVEVLVQMAPPEVPRIDQVSVDAQVLAFALALTTAAGLAFGLVPALQVTRKRLWGRLARATGSRSTIGAPRGHRAALVVAEVALTLLLLVGTGLLLQSLVRLLSQPLGFESDRLVTMQLQATGARFETDEDVRSFYDRLLAEVRAVPGVESAALTSQLPLSEDFDKYGIEFRSRPLANPEDGPSAHRYAVSSGYLRTMGIRVLRGRGLEAGDFASGPDGQGSRPVVLINDTFARRELGDTDPIGEEVLVGGGDENPWRVVVGVVADVRQVSLAAESDAVYVPNRQWPWSDALRTLVVRTEGSDAGPDRLAAVGRSVRERIRALDPDLPVTRVATYDDLVAASTARTRFALLLFEIFAGVAVVLAAIGIFGVLAGVVAEREREIGVRTALGASRHGILWMIVGRGLRLAAAGAVLGLAAAAGFGRFLESQLYGVSGLDAATYAGVTLLLLSVATVACWVPARRATRLDPVSALREE